MIYLPIPGNEHHEVLRVVMQAEKGTLLLIESPDETRTIVLSQNSTVTLVDLHAVLNHKCEERHDGDEQGA